MTTPYHPPVKRSVEIAGHKTSISLEPLFWDLLKAAARDEGVPINALVARIDVERIGAETPPGLASAVRLWLAARLQHVEREAEECGGQQHFDHAPAEAEQQQRG
jgi:predicted DNA-binding ribbon-helix-helix protein